MKYLNCFKQIFFGVGDYDIPEILPESEVSVKEVYTSFLMIINSSEFGQNLLDI